MFLNSAQNERLVYSFPARTNLAENPYNSIFSENMERMGWIVKDATIFESIFGRPAIVHLHWPQATTSGKITTVLRRIVTLLAMLLVQRFKGARIVWTVHNVNAHDAVRPRLEKALMSIVTRLLDGLVFLNKYSREEAIKRYPRLQPLPLAQVAHGVYGTSYPPPPDKQSAREEWGLSGDDTVVGFIGDIKAYKGLHSLLDAASSVTPGLLHTFIAGRFKDAHYAAHIKRTMNFMLGKGHKITLLERRLSDGEMMSAMAASDVIAFPYSSSYNSGLALLAAEKGFPIIMSNNPAFADLVEQIGQERAQTFECLGGEMLLAVANRYRGKEATQSKNFMEHNDWARISAAIDQLYRILLNNRLVTHLPSISRRDQTALQSEEMSRKRYD